MFFTLGYLFLYLYENFSERLKRMRYLRMLRDHTRYASLVFRKASAATSSRKIGSQLVEDNPAGWVESILLQDRKQQILTVSPQFTVDLKKWTSYLDQQNYPNLPVTPDASKCYVLFEVAQPDDGEDFLRKSFSVPGGKRVKVVDYAEPIAWRSGNPFGIVAECSPENLSHLALAFTEGTVLLGDMLELQEMMTISLEGHATNLLRLDSQADTLTPSRTPEKKPSWDNFLTTLPGTDIEEQDLIEGSNESLASSTPNMDRLLELASQCSDADKLETRFSDVNLDTLSEDGGSYRAEDGEEGAGEALSPSIEDIAPEVLTPARRRDVNKSKPPNVVIYCGKKDSARQFDSVKQIIAQCLNPDKYTIYHLKHEQVLTTPWIDNTVLLVVSSEKAYDGVDKAFLKYFQKGGTLLSFACGFDSLFGFKKLQTSSSNSVLSLNYGKWKNISVICGRHMYESCDTSLDCICSASLAADPKTGHSVMVEVCHEESGGVAILSQANLDKDPVEMAISPEVFALLKQSNQARFEILRDLCTRLGLDSSGGQLPDLTQCVLLSVREDQKSKLLKSISPRLQDGWIRSKSLSLHFVTQTSNVSEAPSTDKLPVVCESALLSQPCKFDMNAYRDNLKTQVLGQVVFYTEVIQSTMDVFDGLMFSTPSDLGLVAIAARQTSGKGRSGNAWLSPVGCGMFSLLVRVPLKSTLGQRVAFLQHIASLAVVEAVRDLDGYEELDLRLKWPNDIYFGKAMKLGGVLVNSSIMGDIIYANIGCGFNVSNKDPTICINDLVHQYNRSCVTSLQPFVTEQLIGRTVTKIEELIGQFQKEGPESFLELYYRRWIHSDAIVTLAEEHGESRILGLDEHGYLLVQPTGGTTPVSVHPDGNTYDMMKNLIRPKP